VQPLTVVRILARRSFVAYLVVLYYLLQTTTDTLSEMPAFNMYTRPVTPNGTDEAIHTLGSRVRTLF
jgi:hypothetical protein